MTEENKEVLFPAKQDWRNCKNCGAPPKEQEMRNFDPVGRYADIYCLRCGAFVRTWDPN